MPRILMSHEHHSRPLRDERANPDYHASMCNEVFPYVCDGILIKKEGLGKRPG